MDLGPLDDAAEKRFVTTLISVFGAQPRPCSSVTQFAPGGTKDYRFQDDKASGAAFPANPQFTYVGPLPDGTLGSRNPERRLAATFGQATSTGREPQFSTAPLAEPVTIGGDGVLRAFIQGPSEAVAGLLSGDLVDIDPTGGVAIIGQTPKDVPAKTMSTEPTETTVPLPVAAPHTVPVGHQIGVRFRLTFVGTSAHTLFYDSDKYPSGVTFQTGAVITHDDCPHLVGTSPPPVGGPAGPGDQSAPPTADPPPATPAPPAPVPALPALPGAVPAPPGALPPAPPAPPAVPAVPANPVTPPASPPPAAPPADQPLLPASGLVSRLLGG